MSTMIEDPEFGPCGGWGLTGDDVAAFCPTDAGSDTAALDEYMLAAVQTLFQLSGQQFAGECEVTVRPCRLGSSCWAGFGGPSWMYGSASWGWGWNGTSGAWSFGWYGSDSSVCGCRPLSEVVLAGAPITSIQEILIDGVALDATYAGGSPTYRIDQGNILVRMDDPDDPTVQERWPACQNLALPTTEEGTWSVTYTYGQIPPAAALIAAKQLACALLPGSSLCQIPAGVTKITRQGLSLDRGLFLLWGQKEGSWQTGLKLVDAFLQAYNPGGYDRGPAVWSPDVPARPRHTRV